MRPVELPGVAAALADMPHDLQRVAHENVDATIHPVGKVDEPLLRISREADVPRGA